MSSKRYHVIYTGKTYSHMDMNTIISNVVLALGISSEKASKLLAGGRVMLKRFDNLAEAQSLVDKFDEAGVICSIYDSNSSKGGDESEKSSLSRFFKGNESGEGGQSVLAKVTSIFSNQKS